MNVIETPAIESSEFDTLKPYSPPRLTNYGSVSKLTMGGAYIGNDGNTKCSGNAGTDPACGTPTS